VYRRFQAAKRRQLRLALTAHKREADRGTR
jgi:hypothetical protein